MSIISCCRFFIIKCFFSPDIWTVFEIILFVNDYGLKIILHRSSLVHEAFFIDQIKTLTIFFSYFSDLGTTTSHSSCATESAFIPSRIASYFPTQMPLFPAILQSKAPFSNLSAAALLHDQVAFSYITINFSVFYFFYIMSLVQII